MDGLMQRHYVSPQPHRNTDFSPYALEELGYAQFAGGYITRQMFGWGVPSVMNIKREGYVCECGCLGSRSIVRSWLTPMCAGCRYWAFAPEIYQTDYHIDFLGNAIEQVGGGTHVRIECSGVYLLILHVAHFTPHRRATHT